MNQNLVVFNLLCEIDRQRSIAQNAIAERALNVALNAPGYVLVEADAKVELRLRALAVLTNRLEGSDVTAPIKHLHQQVQTRTGTDRTPFGEAWDNYHNATCAAHWAVGCFCSSARMWSSELHTAMQRLIGQQNVAYQRLRALDLHGVLDPDQRDNPLIWGDRADAP